MIGSDQPRVCQGGQQHVTHVLTLLVMVADARVLAGHRSAAGGFRMSEALPMPGELLPGSAIDLQQGYTWRHGGYSKKQGLEMQGQRSSCRPTASGDQQPAFWSIRRSGVMPGQGSSWSCRMPLHVCVTG